MMLMTFVAESPSEVPEVVFLDDPTRAVVMEELDTPEVLIEVPDDKAPFGWARPGRRRALVSCWWGHLRIDDHVLAEGPWVIERREVPQRPGLFAWLAIVEGTTLSDADVSLLAMARDNFGPSVEVVLEVEVGDRAVVEVQEVTPETGCVQVQGIAEPPVDLFPRASELDFT